MIYVLVDNNDPVSLENGNFDSVEEMFVYICSELKITLENTSYSVLNFGDDIIVTIRRKK